MADLLHNQSWYLPCVTTSVRPSSYRNGIVQRKSVYVCYFYWCLTISCYSESTSVQYIRGNVNFQVIQIVSLIVEWQFLVKANQLMYNALELM